MNTNAREGSSAFQLPVVPAGPTSTAVLAAEGGGGAAGRVGALDPPGGQGQAPDRAIHLRRAPAGAARPTRPVLVDLSLVLALRRAEVRRRCVKRALDVLFAAVGLVLTAPLVLLLGVIIRLDSRGPALLRQVRVGRDGKPFELIKLRSMFEGRSVTRVGRLLRPLGLDELPQLWNVLRGDMSIVGPRPERPHLVEEYVSKLAGYGDRHVVRPGITGWAQIHGLRGGERPIAERLRFDLEYVEAQSLWRDLWILALTLFAVWRDTRRELRF